MGVGQLEKLVMAAGRGRGGREAEGSHGRGRLDDDEEEGRMGQTRHLVSQSLIVEVVDNPTADFVGYNLVAFGSDNALNNSPVLEEFLGTHLFIRGDFNGHIWSTTGGYDGVHGGFGFGESNEGGTSLLDFAKAFGLVIANSSFPKRGEHLVTFQNAVAKTQIDYLLLRRRDRGLCKDCKVIPGEILVTRHRLLVMDVGIMVKRRKMSARGRPRIRWGDKAQELEGRLLAIGAWKSSGDASTIWLTTVDCIREAAKEVLGVSTSISSRHKGDWRWNEVLQGKMEAKKEA
ncbi:uncharacterized protein [Nicotiana sylvestris]|uniref:uncharacterized protein n=1 Tax=Nicotiana sylvestris TaxID=4096 RepID=UPI00388C636C